MALNIWTRTGKPHIQIMQYHILQNGSSAGPYSRETILKLFDNRQLTPATRWRRADDKDWQPIAEFNFSEEPSRFENPFGASRTEKHWAGKYFDAPPILMKSFSPAIFRSKPFSPQSLLLQFPLQ